MSEDTNDTPISPETGIDPETMIIPTPENVYCELEGEAVILDLHDGIYYGLDPVGTSIWEKLQKQAMTFGALVDALTDEYDVERAQCSQDLTELLTAMRGRGLVELKESS